MQEANQFDPECVAGSIASDVYFLWRTSHKFKWTLTPAIMLNKVRAEIAALSEEELQATIETLTLEHGARIEKDEAEAVVALRIRNVLIPINRGKTLSFQSR